MRNRLPLCFEADGISSSESRRHLLGLVSAMPKFIVLLACVWSPLAVGQNGRELPNGIRLPNQWPPANVVLSAEPQPEPFYLAKPPAVIPIDVGRQLFVDDFLIDQTDLRRTFHPAEYYRG